MRVQFPGNWSFTGLIVLADVVFWLVCGVLFVAGSYESKPHKLAFEEATPSYIFFGRALREIDSGTGVSLPPPLMKVTRFIQRPSFIAAASYFWYFNGRGITVDHLYWGISVGGYYLLLVCLLSFLQWYLLGLIIDLIRRHLIASRGRASASPGHAYDAPP